MKTPRPLLCLTLIIAAMLFAAGCKRAATAESKDPKAAVAKTFEKLKQSAYYVEASNPQTGYEYKLYRESANRFWSKVKTFMGESEHYFLVNEIYYQVDGRPWARASEHEMAQPDMVEKDAKSVLWVENTDLSMLMDIRFKKKDLLDGKEVFIYTYKRPGSVPLIDTLWVSAETGLPLKLNQIQEGTPNPKGVDFLFDYEKKADLRPPMM